MKRTRLVLPALAGVLALTAAVTGAMTLRDGVPPVPSSSPLSMAQDIAALRTGLDAISRGDVATALAARDSMAPGADDRRILTWAAALYGGSDLSSSQLEEAMADLSGWPGMAALRRHHERALARENAPPAAMLAAFAGREPETAQGAMALAEALLAEDRAGDAARRLGAFWRETKLDATDELAILSRFGPIIAQADHCHRQEYMLYEDRIRSAGRVAPLCGRPALLEAWAAVIRGRSDAASLLKAVPESERSAGYTYALARFLRRSGKFAEAAEAMAQAPADPAELIDLDQWWVERRALAREMIDLKKYRTAYAIASGQRGGRPGTVADAEFHAGWIALTFLGDAKAAAVHFATIASIADGPISNARAQYWLGRAIEAGAAGDATAHFRRAAQHGTTFYGQLASARLGMKQIDIAPPAADTHDRKLFAARPAVQAIGRLEEAGHGWRAGILYRDLAGELESPGEIALLAGMAESRGDHHTALRIGKIAAGRGLDVGGLAHPMGAIPDDAAIEAGDKALAYAIARQESEFNTGAVSHAGARGLLQLMPGTAREMAGQVGLAYSGERLTSDPAYNATLGAAYLTQQLERFSGSYILTFIAYNAGPRRAAQWIERYGDPRGMPVDAVIDWVERIPYGETRNYVQRVMENLQVYKQRLTGNATVEKDLTAGRNI
ncbi:MAG: lytic transglycosylase domain-containing protein [Zhengella sp.]|uniref:lytic transglycosylase domain-containing protein n=1 Tax=Zhengella sp. TaxID=2282762 RepID=UPI001D64DC3D|nr:lytic transglycosylase domain-containing protein [Notoacmeibacter sp.]MCC0026410.1 lytic transglycosylase domain-containing protein [Brucellaceae bacterium]